MIKINITEALEGKHDEQLNVVLCELMGWKFHPPTTEPHTVEYKIRASACWIPPGADFWQITTIQNYINSLDRMHEVEKKLTDAQWELYRAYLFDFMPKSFALPDCERSSIHATARQRGVAFLRTMRPEIFE